MGAPTYRLSSNINRAVLPQGAAALDFQADLVHILCRKALVPWLRPSHRLQLAIFPSKISNEEKKMVYGKKLQFSKLNYPHFIGGFRPEVSLNVRDPSQDMSLFYFKNCWF